MSVVKVNGYTHYRDDCIEMTWASMLIFKLQPGVEPEQNPLPARLSGNDRPPMEYLGYTSLTVDNSQYKTTRNDVPIALAVIREIVGTQRVARTDVFALDGDGKLVPFAHAAPGEYTLPVYQVFVGYAEN